MKVAVIGTGMAGLGAAWQLKKAGVEVTLFEKLGEVGGRCRTHEWQGGWRHTGAVTFGDPVLIDLAKELGIYQASNIVDLTAEDTFSVLHRDKGLVDIGSMDMGSILTTKAIPLIEKLALAGTLPKLISQSIGLDPKDPAAGLKSDHINACEYLRKFSPSFVDYYLEPLLCQYMGFGEADFSLGYIIASMSIMGDKTTLWSFKDKGVGLMTSTLQQRIEQGGAGTVHVNTQVEHLKETDNGVSVTFTKDGQTQTEYFDAAVCAVPGSLVNNMMPELKPAYRKFFDQVQYVGHHVFFTIIDKPKTQIPYSLLYPTVDGYEVISNSWILPHSEPDKMIFYGEIKGKFIQENRDLSDDEFIQSAWEEACKGVAALRDCEMYDRHFQRNDIGLCSRYTGYIQALADYSKLPPLDHITFAGDYLANNSTGTSYISGTLAAEQILSRVEVSPPLAQSA